MLHLRRSRSLALVALTFIACDGTPEPGVDAGMPLPTLGCGVNYSFPMLAWSAATAGTTVGVDRTVFLRFERDCLSGATLTLTPSGSGIVGVPSTVTVPPLYDEVAVVLSGISEGTITLTASATHESGDTVSADIEVAVTSADIPTCTVDASGNLAPGGTLGDASGPNLTVPEGAARDDGYHVDPFDATIGCGASIVPSADYAALGPAITFGPGHLHFPRDIPLSIPLRLALLPEGANRGHVEVAYLGPTDTTPRIVGIASPRFFGTAAASLLTFEVPRLGTYQAVVRRDAPTRRSRRFKYRGIVGFSMGGSGTGRIGMGNPELFDFVAPLGGPTDWTYMLEAIRRYHVGGFCTEAERLLDSAGCAMGASLAHVPPVTQMHEHPQTFEHWWYEDGYDGQGGTFNRDDYISIFRDLATMFGNPNYDRTADPNLPSITPPGVPDEVRMQSPTLRCLPENQVVIAPFDGAGDFQSGTENVGFFDDEFNPVGAYPVITFCDGSEVDGDIGLWNPAGTPRTPIEVVVAVDINANGLRDLGEPVIRNGREPFEDVGLDGIASSEEPGFNAVTNRDPAGDDFDFQYNPTGTENNWNRDTIDEDPCRAPAAGTAEPFSDIGIDGVANTRQLAAANGLLGGGFDTGEANGCFDRARGAQNMIESSPRFLAQHMDFETLRDIDLLADGGIRDLFNWSVMGNVTTAGWVERGLPIRYYNGHGSLHLDGSLQLDHFNVPWDEVGRFAMIRYGDPDAQQRFIEAGDGGHVGTGGQIIDRLRAGLMMMNGRWPDGDRERITNDRICAENSGCGYVNQLLFDFTASTGRVGPVTMVLPPGYFLPEHADERYPVVFFLHGYGMSPEDLLALGLLLWSDMQTTAVGGSRRMQKMILVFPDGRCRNDECLRGTFYTDAPDNVPGGARMQTFLLDLMAYVDENYRTRDPETFEVVE